MPLYWFHMFSRRAHHDTSCGLQPQREGSNIQKQQVLHLLTALTTENGSLDSCSIGHSLIRVDGLAQLLTVEKVLKHLLNLGDTGGSSNKDNLVHLQEKALSDTDKICASAKEGQSDVGAVSHFHKSLCHWAGFVT